MKFLIMVALFIPVLAPAQHLVVGEQVGYSVTDHIKGFNTTHQFKGFSDQVSVGMRCSKHFYLGLFYEFNSWKIADPEAYGPGDDPPFGKNHSFGGAFDFTSKYLFAGISLQSTKFASARSSVDDNSYSYKGSLCYGVHIGAKQKIADHFSLVEYIGYNWFDIRGANTFTYNSYTHQPPYSLYTSYAELPFKESFHVYCFRVGLIYELGSLKERVRPVKIKKPKEGRIKSGRNAWQEDQ